MRRIAVLLAAVGLLALPAAALAAPAQWNGNFHWATPQEPFQVNPGYGGSFGSVWSQALASWDRAVSLDGSNTVPLGSSEQEFPVFDVADTGQDYAGVTYASADSHGAIRSNGGTSRSGTRIENVGQYAGNLGVVAHEYGHTLGFDHSVPLTGGDSCNEVMSYCGPDLPADEEIAFEDSVIQDHLDGYTTLRGPISDGTPPPPGDRDGDGVADDVDQCPDQPGPASNNGCPTTPPSSGATLVPNSTVSYGPWRTNSGGTSLYPRLDEGTLPPNLPSNDTDYIGARSLGGYTVGLSDLPSGSSGTYSVAAYVHVDQYGSSSSSTYSLRLSGSQVGSSTSVSGVVDGTTQSAWKQVTATGLTASQVNALQFRGSKTAGSSGTYNEAVTVQVTPMSAARKAKRVPFGQLRRHGNEFVYGLGSEGAVLAHFDPKPGDRLRVQPETGLPVGAVKVPGAKR